MPAVLLLGLAILGLPNVAIAESSSQPGPTGLRVVVVLAPSLEGRQVVVSLEATDGERRRTIKLDRSRVASFSGISPAEYEVAIGLTGGPLVRSTVRLEAQELVTVAAFLEVAGSASRAEIVDRQRVAEGTDFDERLLEDLPGADDLWTLVETAVPFVIADRMTTGGLGTGRSALLGSRGASWTSTSVTIGDLVVQDPGHTGLLAIEPDLGAIQAVAVTSGLAPVEVATPGVAISLVPRDPRASAGGMMRASATGQDMVGTNALPHAPSIGRVTSFRDAGLLGAGPLGRRGGVLVSATYSSVRYQERDVEGELLARSASGFGQVTLSPTDRDRLRLMASAQRLTYPFDGRRQFRDRAVDERATLIQSQVGWDRTSDSGSRTSLGVAFGRAQRRPELSGSIGGTVDRLLEGVLPAPAANLVTSQLELRGQWQPRDIRWGSHHNLRVGGTVRRSVRSSSVVAVPVVAEQVGGLPARVWQHQMPSAQSSRTLLDAAVYVADRLTLSPHLTVESGVRLELLDGSAAGADVGLNWKTVSPRLSFRWSPAWVSVFGGYGRYAARHALSLLAFGDPGEPWAEVYRWRDGNADGVFEPAERDELVARAGWGQPVASIAPGLRAPRTHEFTIGGEIRQGARHTFQGAIIVRRQSNLVGSINIGVPLSSYRTFEVVDENADYDSSDDDRPLTIYDRLPGSLGQDEFLLVNPAGATTTYGGIELLWRFRSARWRMLFGASAYRTRGRSANRGFGALENDQHVVGEAYALPNAAPEAAVGSFFFDRSYIGNWSGSYHAPGDVRLAFVARYQDGQPFARVVIAPDLSTGPEMVSAYRVGQTRFTYTLTLDVRVEKGFAIGKRRAALRLDAFNLTNHQNEVEEDVVGGPTFRLSTAVQPPRTLRLGFRFDF